MHRSISHSLVHGLAALLLLWPMLTWAQAGSSSSTASSATATGSGTTASSSSQAGEGQEIVEDRAKRADGLRQKIMQGRKGDAVFHEELAAYRKKRAEFRRTCREDVRRANRDTKFTVTMRCFKGDLALEREFLMDQRTWLEELPAVSTSVRRAATDRVQLLIDALDTVIFAIDSRVYGTSDELIEARTNVNTRYRAPFWQAVALVRADRALSMVGSLIVNLDAVIKAEGPSAPSRADVRQCLTTHETSLRILVELEGTAAASDLGQILPKILTCVDDLSTVKKASGSGSTAN